MINVLSNLETNISAVLLADTFALTIVKESNTTEVLKKVPVTQAWPAGSSSMPVLSSNPKPPMDFAH